MTPHTPPPRTTPTEPTEPTEPNPDHPGHPAACSCVVDRLVLVLDGLAASLAPHGFSTEHRRIAVPLDTAYDALADLRDALEEGPT